MCRKEHHFGGVRAQCFPFFFITRLSCFYMNSIDSLKCMKVTKKEFSKKILNGGSLGSHVDEGRS